MNDRDSRVWLLNPDAERELAAGPSYRTNQRLKVQMESRRDLFADLVGDDEVVFVHEARRDFHGRGRQALLWAPTPGATRVARAAGLRFPRAPRVEILQQVFHRWFLSHAGCRVLPGRAFVEERQQLQRLLDEGPGSMLPGVDEFRLKRCYGFAGKGQLRVGKRLSQNDERWVRESLEAGGLIVEPDLKLPRLVSVHGVVTKTEVLLGHPHWMESDAFGAPREIGSWRRVKHDETALTEAVEQGRQAAHSLQVRGFRGPFGLDLIEREERLFAIDLNPRFTLGWSRGVGDERELLLQLMLSDLDD